MIEAVMEWGDTGQKDACLPEVQSFALHAGGMLVFKYPATMSHKATDGLREMCTKMFQKYGILCLLVPKEIDLVTLTEKDREFLYEHLGKSKGFDEGSFGASALPGPIKSLADAAVAIRRLGKAFELTTASIEALTRAEGSKEAETDPAAHA